MKTIIILLMLCAPAWGQIRTQALVTRYYTSSGEGSISFQQYICRDSAIVETHYPWLMVTDINTGNVFEYQIKGIDSSEVWTRFAGKDWYVFGKPWKHKYSDSLHDSLKQRTDVWLWYTIDL